MTDQTWQKACDCKGATATSGRIPFDIVTLRGAFAVPVQHFGPVCGSCDTPWILADTPAKAEA